MSNYTCPNCGQDMDPFSNNPCECDCDHTSLAPSGRGYVCDECGAYLNDYYEVED